jgi:signal transduction histidine kinase
VSDRLQHLVKSALSHTKVNYQFLLQDYGRELTLAPLRTERILAMFLDRCEAAIHPDRAVVFLGNPALNTYSVSQQIGQPLPPDSHLQFAADDELPRRLAAIRTGYSDKTEALHISLDSGSSPLDGFSADESSRLAVLDTELFVPLHGTEQLIGWIALGSRQSGESYRQKDLAFLTTLANQTAIALENAQLLEATERRALQLTSLNQVSRSINQTLDLDKVLQLIMEKSLELLDAEAGSVLLTDEDDKYLTFEVVLGPVGNQLRGARQAIGSGIVGTVAHERKPLIVNEAQTDPRWDISFDRTTEFVTRNLICVPMISHDRLIGVIEVLNKRVPARFSEEDTELLSSFAAQAAIAIENARLFTMTDQALAERVQQLHTMQVIDQQLNATLDFTRVLDLTLQHAMDALGADTGVVGILDKEENGLHLAAQQGAPTDYDRYRDEWWPTERGVIGQVARTGQPIIINAGPAAPDFDPINPQARSQITVPIHYQDKVQAVVSLESARPEAFNQSDLEFITRLADHAAIAIENARLYEQAQAANQAKTEFMSVASHELKIPMTSIKGYAKLLTLGAAGELNERQRDFLEIISSNVDRMDRLVADLLDVSRIEAGRLRLEMGRVDVQKAIETVVQAVKTQIEAKELTLQLDLPPGLPPAWGDQDRLVQIVTNLVSNAYKYTPNGGKITITVTDGQAGSQSRDFLTISIRDTGVGISPEDQQKLFTKFFRADDPHVRDVPGTGLGLSITKSLVEIHGGEIWFESEVDQGTTFSFTLPTAPPDNT